MISNFAMRHKGHLTSARAFMIDLRARQPVYADVVAGCSKNDRCAQYRWWSRYQSSSQRAEVAHVQRQVIANAKSSSA